jgi:hypothetical protein
MDGLMGYEDDMDDYYDDQLGSELPLEVGSMQFSGKNRISCNGVSLASIIYNYLCWKLGGRPQNWRVYGK